MLAALARIFTPSTVMAERYRALVEQARTPYLFTHCGIPDSLDGRFESVVMHIALACRQGISPHEKRDLMEFFIEDMDRSLREIGVGDTGIGKRVKKMAAGLLGRLQAYEKAGDDKAELRALFLRNAYSTCATPPDEKHITALVDYFLEHASSSAKLRA